MENTSIDQGPYRKNANPHKEAYQREERVKRILERAPKKLRELNEKIDWLCSSQSAIVTQRDVAYAKLEEAKEANDTIGSCLAFILILASVLGYTVYKFSCSYDALEQENASLASEILELRDMNDRLDASLVSEQERSLGERIGHLRELHRVYGELFLAERRSSHLSSELDATSAVLERVLSLAVDRTAHSSPPAPGDPLVTDDWGVTCRESQLVGPEGDCP